MTLEGPPVTAGIHALSPADRIDLVCDDFEDQWRTGPPPAVEDYLPRCDSADRRELFTELLLVDFEQRTARRDPPAFDEYLGRFAEYAAELKSIWLRLGTQETVDLASSTDTPTERYSAGMHIAQFQLLKKLGSGGAGEVWKAHDTRLQRTVAIKVPRHQQLSDDELGRFLREGRAAAQMRHSHLVSVHEVGRDGKTAFIVSDFIEGEDLRAWLRRRQPTTLESAHLAADVAEALHHAHEHGVIHRDLKPANVLMDREGKAHVTDFGLAKWTEDARDMTVDGQILGTPAYMSPEQARGEAHRVDCRTDVYGLGTLLYELLTGRRPFEGDQATVMHHIVSSEPTRPRSLDKRIPRDLETVCLKAMEKDPARRYPSAQEMAVDLRRYLRGEPILARSAGRLERGVRWIRRHPAVASSILLSLIAIGSIAVARMFAEENRQLMGLRLVTLSTEPVGAQVTFVPLNEVTEEPMPEKMIHARTPSPVVEELRPGDYLVVAVLDDGRFHEVFRHVPGKEENVGGHFNHLHWTLGKEGTIALPHVKIPSQDVTDGMAFIEGTKSRVASLDSSKLATKGIASFYVDLGEVSVGDYIRLEGELPNDRRWKPVPESFALTSSYDLALRFAEKIGKRLPTVHEFVCVASQQGKTVWPWGDDPPEDSETGFGPIGTPQFDCLAEDPRVVGLVSNVAEWTSSSAAEFLIGRLPFEPKAEPPKTASHSPAIVERQFKSSRWIVGGDEKVIAGSATVSAMHRAPVARSSRNRTDLCPGLGFRCVRSAQPRNVPEAF